MKRGALYHAIGGGPAGRSKVVGRRELVAERPSLGPVWAAVDALFPVRIPRSWWNRVNPDDPHDPLAVQVLPAPSELVVDDGDLDDPVGERELCPVPWVVRKYDDRVLVLLTKRCLVYCRYCFRRTHAPGDALDPTPDELAKALDYAADCGAREAILSGGDPLAIPDDALFSAIDRLREGRIKVVRLHTRAPIAHPDRVTDALVQGLKARRPAWIVVHTNHPRELAPDVDAAIARMVDAGLPVLNQSVLLKGVNDDPAVLQELSEALVERGVTPYYLHHTDTVSGNAPFRVTLERGLAIHAELARRVSGVALPAYVIDPPDGGGKRPVADWVRTRRGEVASGACASRQRPR